MSTHNTHNSNTTPTHKPEALTSIYGKTAVTLLTWRSSSGTIFRMVTISDPWHHSRFQAHAHSQGPSACGYNKRTQSLERLSDAMRINDHGTMEHACASDATWAQIVAQIAEASRTSGRPAPWTDMK